MKVAVSLFDCVYLCMKQKCNRSVIVLKHKHSDVNAPIILREKEYLH